MRDTHAVKEVLIPVLYVLAYYLVINHLKGHLDYPGRMPGYHLVRNGNFCGIYQGGAPYVTATIHLYYYM